VAKYALSRAADIDLTDIYTFTHNEFGEQQADLYFSSIDDCLTRLAVNPRLGRDVGFVRKGYRRFVHRRHSIYYQSTSDGILVVRVLGPGMLAERSAF